MPPPIPVNLVSYNGDWPRMAAAHGERLRTVCKAIVAVHHIGSTAVPGLVAKPILDLMPLVTDLTELDAAGGQVEALGYAWHGEFGIPGRRYCTLADEPGSRIVQLHFFQADSPHARRHLAFRDYLRAHPEVRTAYESEKRRARDLYPDDSHAYSGEKAAWIQRTEVEALRWCAKR